MSAWILNNFWLVFPADKKHNSLIILSYLAVFALNWICASWTKNHVDPFKWYFNDISHKGLYGRANYFWIVFTIKLKRNILRPELKKYMLKRAFPRLEMIGSTPVKYFSCIYIFNMFVLFFFYMFAYFCIVIAWPIWV